MSIKEDTYKKQKTTLASEFNSELWLKDMINLNSYLSVLKWPKVTSSESTFLLEKPWDKREFMILQQEVTYARNQGKIKWNSVHQSLRCMKTSREYLFFGGRRLQGLKDTGFISTRSRELITVGKRHSYFQPQNCSSFLQNNKESETGSKPDAFLVFLWVWICSHSSQFRT